MIRGLVYYYREVYVGMDFDLIQETLENLDDSYGDCSLRIFCDGSGYIIDENEDIIFSFDNIDGLFELCRSILVSPYI